METESFDFLDGSKYPNLNLHNMDRQVGNWHGVLLKNVVVHYTSNVRLTQVYASPTSHLKYVILECHFPVTTV